MLEMKHDRILLRERKTVQKTAVEFTKDKSAATETGEVVAVGPGFITDAGILIPVTVQVGDVVVYLRPTDVKVEVEVDGEKMKIINDRNVLAVQK